ncbi:MAG: DUF4123 domain-containing protein [Aliishimia sp.]
MTGLPLAPQDDTLPEAVFETLFGPSDADAPLPCYVLVDACKINGLPEILETSNLAHRCLFQGEALEDLGDVAPWLVALTPNAPFTLQLLTAADPQDPVPWHMWQTMPGLFLRSPLNIAELWSHLRRFTRVRADDDSWFFYRFWEPAYGVEDVLPRAGSDSILTQWLYPRSSPPLRVIKPFPQDNELRVFMPAQLDETAKNRQLVVTQSDRDVLADLARLRHDRALQTHLVEIAPVFASQSKDAQWDWLTRALNRGEGVGLHKADALRNFVEAALLLGAWPDEDPELQNILSDHTLHELDKARLIRQSAKKRHNRR